MDSKSLSSVQIKNADEGRVEAVFSTFGVVDHDGDITEPGAFENGAKVLISAYNHKSWDGALPVGTGRIEVTPLGAVMKGQFFMNTQQGRDTFETLKSLHQEGLGEWSYGFTVDDSEQVEVEGKSVRKIKKLSVFEVSPVLKGAGIGTRTTSVKVDGSVDVNGREEFDRMFLEYLAKDAQRGYGPNRRRRQDEDDEDQNDRSRENDDEEDEDEENPRRRREPARVGKASSLREEIDLAVDAARSAIESAERVVALRAEAEKQLSNVNLQSLGGLRDALVKLDELLAVETKQDATPEQKEFLRYVAFNLEDSSND